MKDINAKSMAVVKLTNLWAHLICITKSSIRVREANPIRLEFLRKKSPYWPILTKIMVLIIAIEGVITRIIIILGILAIGEIIGIEKIIR